MKLPDQRKAVRRWAVRHYSTMVGYHAVRLPCIYTPKLLAYSPRGAWRWSTLVGRWVFDAEGKGLRLAAVQAEDAAEYLKLARQRNDRVRLRGIVTTAACFVGLAAALTLYVMAPSWSGRRVSYWIADRDPLAVPAGCTPLLGATRVDF
ncbi:hypothetical protein AB0D27_10900 [Streptomyces sp. NPDC048415]|uniref:hypothetical protein n=1 Tax=Streptomyces sp. NPDC048415 TaxID=3154822 RepID=UPI00343D1880